jgi:hypothetical protein
MPRKRKKNSIIFLSDKSDPNIYHSYDKKRGRIKKS